MKHLGSKMKKRNVKDGADLQRQMEEGSVSVSRLAKVIGVDERTIYNYRSGKTTPNKERKLEIDQFLRMNSNHRVGLATHPHQELLRTLVQMTGGMNYEVLGLPGMLKTEVLKDLESALKVEKARQFFFHDLGTKNDVDEFWNLVGKGITGDNKRQHTLDDVRATVNRDFRLLLDDADLFLHNVQKKCLHNGTDFATVGSQWIKNVENLPCSVVLTSTIATGDFVSLAAGGSPHFFNELEISQWCKDEEWGFWTEALLDGDASDAINQLNESSKGIPLVFLNGLKALRAHGRHRLDHTIAAVQRNIAISIWHRLPAAKRIELRRQNFVLSNGSSIVKVLAKSGVLTESSSRFSIRVPNWLQTWKEAVAQ